MKKLIVACSLLTMLPAAAIAESCKVKDRYSISGGQDLSEGDVLELRIGNRTITETLTSGNAYSYVWPALLAEKVNSRVNSNVASAGGADIYANQGHYVGQYTSLGNIIDVFQKDVPVSLTLNGVDYSSQLTTESLPTGNYSGEADLNQFYAGTERAAVLYVKNSSDVDVSVNVELKEYDGSNYSGPYTPRYGFSTANNPVTGFTTLAAGTLGDVLLNYRSINNPSYAKIKWTSTECVDKPLSVQLEQSWSKGGMSHIILDAF